MIMIKRTLYYTIEQKFFKGKAIILLGQRQVGKTTLIKELLLGKPHLFLNDYDPELRGILEGIGASKLQTIKGKNDLVYIDEAKRISDIGITLKLITDQFKHVQLLVKGL